MTQINVKIYSTVKKLGVQCMNSLQSVASDYFTEAGTKCQSLKSKQRSPASFNQHSTFPMHTCIKQNFFQKMVTVLEI